MRTAILSGALVAVLSLSSIAGDTNRVIGVASTSVSNTKADVEILLREHLEQRRIVIDHALSDLKMEIHKVRVDPIVPRSESAKKTEDDVKNIQLHFDKRNQDLARIARVLRLLGDIQATEAMPILMDNLSMNGSLSLGPRSLIAVTSMYPALDALVRIGKPGVQGIIDGIGTLKEEDERTGLAVSALVSILGEDAAHTLLLSRKGKGVGYDTALSCLESRYFKKASGEKTHTDGVRPE